MPGVWNINNGYNVNTKKISSKLTFEVGERFTGKIVAKGEGKDVTIKLSDGWQFIAELDGKVNLDELRLVRFQVDGFENGKLRLKLVQGNEEESSSLDENFQEVIDKEGLSKEDIEILKKMVKHNLPLTRENINEIKGLIQFNEKMALNPKEIDAFIQTYLQSKGIAENSPEGQAVKELLSKFFSEFKNMSSQDILAFIENKLEFSKENISSFNSLFKGNSSIEEILKKLNDALKSLELSEKISNDNIAATINSKLLNKEGESARPFSDAATALASKVYNENDSISKKINIIDVLKTLAGSENSELDMIQKNAGKETIKADSANINLPASLIEKLDDEQVAKLIKDTIGESLKTTDAPKTQAESLIESTNKSRLEEIFSKIEGKDIKLTDKEFKAFTELFNNKIQSKDVMQENVINNRTNAQPQDAQVNAVKDSIKNTEIFSKLNPDDIIRGNIDNKDSIKNQMKNEIDHIRDIVKNLINQTNAAESSVDKITNLMKSHINDIKVFNTISDEYYYLNFPIKSGVEEYPCKLIIKDNRKDGKKIDSTNAKMVVSVKTINLGEVDGYLTMRDNKIDVKLRCDDNFTTVLNNNKSKLIEGLQTLGLFVNVTVAPKDKPVDLVNCRNFFNDLTISAIDIKV